MKYAALICCLIFSTLSRGSDPLMVGIFNGERFAAASVTVMAGSYDITTGEKHLFQCRAGQTARISIQGNQFVVEMDGRTYPASGQVIWSGNGEYKVSPSGIKPNNRIYPGELIVRPTQGRLRLISRVELETYVPGVVEAEGGSNHHFEYYKVQAIISRTYAVNNLRRHEAEGFHLCDGTHCQVYHGRPRHEQSIAVAAEETRDVVIVDDDIELITAAFHSNCGGHTVNAEHVWSRPLSYCVGRPDTFCLVMPHSNWEKSISTSEWRNYLESKRPSRNDSLPEVALAYFPSEKEQFFSEENLHIPMRTIRNDLKLRSAFFSVHQEGESVTLIGQGFGHGVGLCQEGAMRMAQLGYSCEEIVHFYYRNVHLVPKRFIWFFRED